MKSIKIIRISDKVDFRLRLEACINGEWYVYDFIDFEFTNSIVLFRGTGILYYPRFQETIIMHVAGYNEINY